MLPGVITAARLAEVLRVSRTGLLAGKHHSGLPVTYLNQQRVFTFEEADKFILSCARNGMVPPSAYELINSIRRSENLIITPKEAGKILGRTEHSLSVSRRVNSHPYLQIGGLIRYAKSEVIARAERRNKSLDSRGLKQILCVSDLLLKRLINEGLIKVHRKGPKGIRYEADRAHLRVQLREWLPPYVDPDDWIAQQMEATEPAVPLMRVGVDPKTAKRMIREFELPYIKVGKVRWNIPAETARAIVANNMPAMEVAEIARLFDVTTEQANMWVQQKVLICPMHTNKHAKCLRPACLRRFIQSHSNVADRWRWYRRRMEEGERLYGDNELIGTLGKPCLITAIETRKLQGVRLPGEEGGWRFLHGDFKQFVDTHKF